MSRRMPPTPVAAPWKGSTALGWLCDSTLNAHARPPPTSTAPAFSPGPTTTCSPSVGSVRRSLRECLYAQCSDHISEYIASSSTFGARPCNSQISSYSAAVSPSASASLTPGVASLTRSALSGKRALERLAHRAQDAETVARAAEELVDSVLGVGHQPEDVAPLAAHAGDVAQRAVEVLAARVAEHDLPLGLEPRERALVGVVAAARVLGGDAQVL